jgi:hypothetical protein
MATPQEERDALAAKLAGAPSAAPTDRDSFLSRLRGVLPSKLTGKSPLEEVRAKLEGKPIGPDPAVVAAPVVQRPADPAAPPEAAAAISMPVIRRPAEEPKLELKMPTVGGGGGGGMNPLQQATLDARRRQLGTLGEERELTGDLGASRAGRMMATSELGEQEALRQQAAAERQRQIDEEAHTKMQGYLERNQKRADEIGSMKVDPHRLMRDATAGQQVAMAIGQMLGGALAARQGGGANQFQAHLDKAIDRDINAQLNAIENKKTALSESRSIFGQMLAETGDARAAANEYRAQIYKSAQVSLQAKADALGIPEARANAELASNAIQQKIDGLGVQNADAAWKQYQQQAAAAAAQRAAAEKMAWDRAMQLEEMKNKAYNAETARLGVSAKGEKGSDLDPRFVATGKDAQGNATGYVARSPEEAAKKEDGRVAAQKAIDLIDDTLRIRKEQGGVGRTLGRQFAWTVPEWQTQVRSNEAQLKASVNKAAHLGTLDKGTEPLLNAMAGDLESAGESSDVKLMQLRASLERQMAAETSGAAGQGATKTVDPKTGRVVIVPTGSVNAPLSEMPAAAAGTKDR